MSLTSIGHFFIETSLSGREAEILKDLHYIYRRSQLPISQDCKAWDDALQSFLDSDFTWACIYSEWFCGANFNELDRALREIPHFDDFYLGISDPGIPDLSVINKNSLRQWMEEFGFLPSYDMVRKLAFPWSFSSELKSSMICLSKEDLASLSHRFARPRDPTGETQSFAVEKVLRQIDDDRKAAGQLVFLVHNESLTLPTLNETEKSPFREIETLYMPASGLKPLALLSQVALEKIKRVVFFDLSKPALDFYRHLIEHWEGEAYDVWVRDLVSSSEAEWVKALGDSPDLRGHVLDQDGSYNDPYLRLKKKYESLLSFIGGPERLKEILAHLRLVDVEYRHLDIISEFKKLGIGEQASPSLLWLSNIYSYRPTFFQHGGIQGLRVLFDELVTECARAKSPAFLFGDLPTLGGVRLVAAHSLSETRRPSVKREFTF